MTCACSRRQYELKKERVDVSLHCTENGNYETLQCDNGLCWCVEPKSGKPTQRAYPQNLMTYLSCYDNEKVGSQYLRQCESKSIAVAKFSQKIKYRGHKYYHLENSLCSADGSYDHYQIDHNLIRCTWKDGKQIKQYQTIINNILTTNCNCARDSVLDAESNAEFRLLCKQDTGNYEPHQFVNGRPFCVDQDGFATTDLGNIGESLKCV